MLTATYSLVAIANEQNSMRRILRRLHQGIRRLWDSLYSGEPKSLESAYASLAEFDRCCRQRKVERYLIPALRRVTVEADILAQELEAISAAGRRLLRNVGEQLKTAIDLGGSRAQEVCSSMDQYCHKVLYRLAREESELFPMATRVFSVEEWFAIAEKFLSIDGQLQRGRYYSHPAPLLASRSEQRLALH